MVPVASQAILKTDYDPATTTLFVRFTDGDWYSYAAVPASVHRTFLTAESHGRYIQHHIRDRDAYRKGHDADRFPGRTSTKT